MATAGAVTGSFVLAVVLSDGAAGGWLAAVVALAVATALVGVPRRRRRQAPDGRPVPPVRSLCRPRVAGAGLAMLLVFAVCIPEAPSQPRLPADPSGSLGGSSTWWTLPTGSRVAVYHYAPAPGTPHRAAPLLYLHGGQAKGLPLTDHQLLADLSHRGYDVWAYEQPGAGRSGLLDVNDYGIERQVADLHAVLDRLGPSPIDVLAFSAGGSVLARALTDEPTAARIRRAVLAEPGPMDGPTAAMTGPLGQPNAQHLAASPSGAWATRSPRYLTAMGLEMARLLPLRNGLVPQGEMVNVWRLADLGSERAADYCAADAARVPRTDPGFSFNVLASWQVQRSIARSPSLAPALARSHTPVMLLLAQCSMLVRAQTTAVLADDPAVDRVQVMPHVGHWMWNGLDDNDARVEDVVTAYLEGRPAPLPNHPTRAELPDFLAAGR